MGLARAARVMMFRRARIFVFLALYQFLLAKVPREHHYVQGSRFLYGVRVFSILLRRLSMEVMYSKTNFPGVVRIFPGTRQIVCPEYIVYYVV